MQKGLPEGTWLSPLFGKGDDWHVRRREAPTRGVCENTRFIDITIIEKDLCQLIVVSFCLSNIKEHQNWKIPP